MTTNFDDACDYVVSNKKYDRLKSNFIWYSKHFEFLFNSDNIGVLEPFIEKLNYQKLADRQYIKSLTKHLIGFANTAYEQNKIDLAFYLRQNCIYNWL